MAREGGKSQRAAAVSGGGAGEVAAVGWKERRWRGRAPAGSRWRAAVSGDGKPTAAVCEWQTGDGMKGGADAGEGKSGRWEGKNGDWEC